MQAILDDAGPKLDGAAERLVDVAQTREKVAGTIQDLKAHPGAPLREGPDTDLAELENELRAADAEITSAFEKLLTLRAQVVRISVESGGAIRDTAAKLNTDLDEMNLRLDALRSTMSPARPLDQQVVSNSAPNLRNQTVSGMPPASKERRICMRSSRGGWVEKRPLARFSNFFIGLTI